MRAMKAYRFLAFMIAVLVVVQAGAIAWAFFGLSNWITDDGGVVNKELLECTDDCESGVHRRVGLRHPHVLRRAAPHPARRRWSC